MNKVKIPKSILKPLIKECIMEVFADFFSNDTIQPSIQHKKIPENLIKNPQSSIIKNSIVPPGLTKDSIMQSIFEETAKTTVIQQNLAEADTHLQSYSKQNIKSVDDIPDGNGLWSDIAFAPSKK